MAGTWILFVWIVTADKNRQVGEARLWVQPEKNGKKCQKKTPY
jgi:hypothetical protein